MRMVDLILKKRENGELTRDEIRFIINGFVCGEIPDYQISAWMMAVCFNGMTKAETGELTMAMTESGDVVDLSELPGVKVDKHSTGGVGDTTTLVVAPLCAACGATVAKMSGRGLGHTGGTLDKLEAVPGVSVAQPIDEFKRIVKKIGVCVIGQTGNLVPADKLMYALRDVTGTVQSIPLIASSIMSKKIAAGTDAIVLDVKMGTGAFMQTLEQARELAHTMVQIGGHLNRRTVAIITDMNQPLGMAVGNGLEVREAIDMLSGRVKQDDPLYQVCMLLATNMLLLSNLAETEADAMVKLTTALQSGQGLIKLKQMLEELGGDAKCIEQPELLCNARLKLPVRMDAAGYIGDMNAERIGVAAQLLGAGRAQKTDTIDPAVGLVMNKRRGEYIAKDETLATLYVNDETKINEARSMLISAVHMCDQPPKHMPMVYDVIRE
ncbi:MAG: thymidine phosphorylase [Clostridia bacterium]